MQNNKTIAISPGETIEELLEDRGIPKEEFINRMDMSEKHIDQLLSGRMHLTKDIANKLENIFNIPASFWKNLETIYLHDLSLIMEENKE